MHKIWGDILLEKQRRIQITVVEHRKAQIHIPTNRWNYVNKGMRMGRHRMPMTWRQLEPEFCMSQG